MQPSAWGSRTRTMPDVTETSVTTFVAGMTLTLFPAVLSPKPWPVGVVVFAIQLLLRVVPAAYIIISFEYVRPRAPGVVVAITANAVGGLLALCLIKYLQRDAGHAIEGGSR